MRDLEVRLRTLQLSLYERKAPILRSRTLATSGLEIGLAAHLAHAKVILGGEHDTWQAVVGC